MALLPPKVIGPLSACNHEIEVQGQLITADVEIAVYDTVVAGGKAASSDQVFPLLPQKSLPAGAPVFARQRIGQDTSVWSPLPVFVQNAPPQIGSVLFTHTIYQCGVCAGLGGAVPGASVEVRAEGDKKPRGTGVSPHGTVGLGLNPATGPSVLLAKQSACGMPGPETAGAAPEKPPAKLPPPVFQTPVRECQSYVALTGVLPGAVLTVTRDNVVKKGCYVADVVYFPVDTPLNAGEKLTAKQEFPGCHSTSPEASATVVPLDQVPAPIVIGPLCAGSGTVPLANLIPGALFRIKVNGQEKGVGQAPPGGFFACPIYSGSFFAGQIVTAQQQLCGKWSDDSNPVTVLPGGTLPIPSISGPLVACGGAVRVQNTHPGSWVYVLSNKLGAPIGEAFALSDTVDVLVDPTLIQDDFIRARSSGCGDQVDSKQAVHVDPAPTGLSPPGVKSVETTAAVTVSGVVPGAFVDVQVNGLWRGGKFCAAGTDLVPISGALTLQDGVQARQRLCGMVSQYGAPVKPLPSPPVAHFTAIPESGQAPLSVKFIDQSTGAPTKWFWDFGDQSTFDKQTPPAHLYTGGGLFQVSLTVSNGGGESKAYKTITVQPAPAAPFISAYKALDPNTKEWIVKVKGMNFKFGHPVTIHVKNTANPPDEYDYPDPVDPDQFGNFDTPINYSCPGNQNVNVEVQAYYFDDMKKPVYSNTDGNVKC